MDEKLTKEQKTNLKVWAVQRDELLKEVQNLKISEEKLQKRNIELANSNTDIEDRMNVIKGRIEELKVRESEIPTVISTEIALLETKKTTLESEITLLDKVIRVLVPQKSSLEADVTKALATLNVVKGETLLLDRVVDRVTKVSKNNTDKINLLVSDLDKSLKEIIAVNKKNVFETNIVIEKLPKMIMEAQKHGLIKNKI